MSDVFVTEDIQTEESNREINLDEMNRGAKGDKGDKGDKGLDGRDGLDGKDGKDGKDGRDGRDGVDGKNGRDGVDGRNGIDGRDGKDGTNGTDGRDGKNGIDGLDGTQFILFKDITDENVGKENDLALVQKTSDYYRKENGLWKWKGNLKGKDGQDGREGRNGIWGGADAGSGGGGVQHTFICADIYDDGTNFLVSSTCRLYDQTTLNGCIELINLVESA